jgi:TolA-binding protein
VKSDELEKAFSALREETQTQTGGDEPRARATLARVLTTSRRASRRRLRLFKLWLPLAAVLVASTAWAAASGRLDGLVTNPPALEPTHRSEWVTPVVEGPRMTQLAVSRVTADPEPMPSAAPTTSAAVVASADAGAATTLALDKAAYEVAYRQHSKTGDSAAANAAVAAWDKYISQFPRGRFLPEARYARAVALARAGRAGEAKQAMEPFAAGDGYRKADAERWIESLDKK